jgi:hypothetical protein
MALVFALVLSLIFYLSIGLTIVHFCESCLASPCMSLKMNRDAVATDIIHQHSGRLDYYKGFVISPRNNIILKIFPPETLPNSILQNRSATVIYARNTIHRWNTVNICRRLLTDGGIMRIVVRFGAILLVQYR